MTQVVGGDQVKKRNALRLPDSHKDDSTDITQTMRLRAEFSVQAGSKKFNPVAAANSLLEKYGKNDLKR